MKPLTKIEILIKVIWIGLFLNTVYVFAWMTFGQFMLGNIGTEKFTSWNLVANIFTIAILFVYAKEFLFGYESKSEIRNIKSFLLFTTLIIALTLIQFPQFEVLFNDSKSQYWQIILSLLIILTS